MKEAAHFVQSVSDFPLMVSLGEKAPAWGLTRWGGGGLRFVPPDDEGFTLRGDRRRLVYKGKRRSHRFTILDGNAFEYDVILEREPESNVIALDIEGAERYEFCRQPDFLKNQLLAGSYAVYKKETLLGEGTGKLCHIFRPEIIDAQGRRCWGDIVISGSQLRISIPEEFLAHASYPVIVDPAIGTSTVGSQYLWDNDDPGEPLVELYFEVSIPVNRYLVSETINGNCTAYFYTNEDNWGGGGRPVLYSDYGNTPLARRSKSETWIDFHVTSGKPKGWRSGTFSSNGSIAAGSYIWFGCFTEYHFFPRFDWGAKCYKNFWDDYDGIPETYPLYDSGFYYNFKLSMYFSYTTAQNHVRTLTQGVKVAEARKLTAAYQRSRADTVRGNGTASRFAAFPRKCLSSLYSSRAEILHQGNYCRWEADTAQSAGLVFRGLLIFARILTVSFVRDFFLRRFLRSKEELFIKSGISRDFWVESRI